MSARLRTRSEKPTQQSNSTVKSNLPFADILHKIDYVDPKTLTPAARRIKKHSKAQIETIKASIVRFGFNDPIVLTSETAVGGGHGRLEAALQLGLPRVPTINLSHLTEAEQRVYLLAENQIAMKAGYDKKLLGLELMELDALELEFDLEITGFSTATIDYHIGIVQQPEEEEEEETPSPTEEAVTVLGDIWTDGKSRLMCGDVRNPENVRALMDGDEADLVASDPPYGCKVQTVSGLGRAQHAEFAMASGEMNSSQLEAFFAEMMQRLSDASRDGALQFFFIDRLHTREMLNAGTSVYRELKDICVWNKTNAGMGSLYRSKHEFICLFKKGKAPHINNIRLGADGRYRTNVWDYAGMNSFRRDRDEALASHPTVKPVELMMDLIKDVTKRGGIVLDGFGGSGTTLLAAHKTRRRGYLMEIEPKYVDLTVHRWEKLTGNEVRHAVTGQTFRETARERGVVVGEVA